MGEFLSRIGLFSIWMLILYIIKKTNDYFYFKNEESKIYKFDQGDDE